MHFIVYSIDYIIVICAILYFFFFSIYIYNQIKFNFPIFIDIYIYTLQKPKYNLLYKTRTRKIWYIKIHVYIKNAKKFHVNYT